MSIKIIEQRFQDLEDSAKKVLESSQEVKNPNYVDQLLYTEWVVRFKSLAVDLTGENSQYFKRIIKSEDVCYLVSNKDVFSELFSVFEALKKDFKGGFLNSLENIVKSELFESELEQAEELLDKGYYVAAAVIAGIVLETTLRELCGKENILYSKNVGMDQRNIDLAKKGVYGSLIKKRITALADLRNHAAHGRKDEFKKQDVVNMIRDVERFIADHFV